MSALRIPPMLIGIAVCGIFTIVAPEGSFEPFMAAGIVLVTLVYASKPEDKK